MLILIACSLDAQPPADRYRAEIFAVTETNDILFSTGVPQANPGGGFYEFVTGYPLNVDEFDTSPVDLRMDIFQPAGDTLAARPLIIICFGGGFLSGSRDHWSIRLLCQDLAKRGYVTATIDYRLGMNIFDSDLANRAVYRGLQDARSAVRFFRADAAGANSYKVDPDHIFIGGHSSGGFMALHNAYLDQESERPLSTFEWSQDGNFVADQGCLDCAGDNTEYNGHANAIFSLAGAVGFTSFIESDADPEVVMFHSTDDGTVPYTSGEPFSGVLWLVIGDDLPTVYGSSEIADRADEVGLPYEFFSYTSRGHDVHEDGSSSLYTDIVPGISDWFLERQLVPTLTPLVGDSIICDNYLTGDYHLEGSDATYFDWQAVGGNILFPDPTLQSVEVEWLPNNTQYQLSVRPYSDVDAAGDLQVFNVDMQANVGNHFLGIDDNWSLPANWSLNHLPIACEDVTFENLPMDITVSESSEINSLHVPSEVSLILLAGMTISVKDAIQDKSALQLDGVLVNESIISIYSRLSSQQTYISESAVLDNGGVIKISRNQ